LSKRNSGPFTDGWDFVTDAATGKLLVRAQFAVEDLQLLSLAAVNDGIWRHFALDWDQGTLTGRMFVNGALQATDTATGAYQADATYDCICNGLNAVGNSDQAMSIGWIRLSSTRRYIGTSFGFPIRNNLLANDANAQLLIHMNEGMGTTAADSSGNNYNGTITFGASTRWYNDPKGL